MALLPFAILVGGKLFSRTGSRQGKKKVPDRLRRGRGREAGPGPSQFVAELNRK